MTICNKKEVYEITDLVEIEFSLANLKQKDLSLYLKVYEKNSWAAGGYEEVKIENHYKGDVRGFGYFLCKQKHGVLNEYSCIVSLGELEKIDRFIMEYGDWDLCFSISLDYEGKHCILFANEERYSETIQFKRE